MIAGQLYVLRIDQDPETLRGWLTIDHSKKFIFSHCLWLSSIFSLFLRLPAVCYQAFLLLLFVPCPPQLFPGEISLRWNDEDHKKGRNVRGERNIIRKIMHSSFVPIILSPSLLSEVILDYIQLLGLWVLSWHLLYFPTFHKVGWICHQLHFFVILRLSKN